MGVSFNNVFGLSIGYGFATALVNYNRILHETGGKNKRTTAEAWKDSYSMSLRNFEILMTANKVRRKPYLFTGCIR